MNDLILHHYDASPFTQKALRMLGIKRLAWSSVQTPMLPPKDDLVALTGGYRGTPVLQIGADVYIDSQRIAMELESRYPTPSLFPQGDIGVAQMLTKWSETMFRAALVTAVEQTGSMWPEPFMKDRQFLFPDFDFAAALRGSAHSRAQFRVHAGWLNQQLSDGRPFLMGAAPGLADVQGHVFVAMARGAFPTVATELLGGFDSLAGWEQRVAALGEGVRIERDAAYAFAAARAAKPVPTSAVESSDPLQLRAGSYVEVAPDDTRRGGTRGELVTLAWNEVAVRHRNAQVGEVVVHFPRIGYRVSAIAADANARVDVN